MMPFQSQWHRAVHWLHWNLVFYFLRESEARYLNGDRKWPSSAKSDWWHKKLEKMVPAEMKLLNLDGSWKDAD